MHMEHNNSIIFTALEVICNKINDHKMFTSKRRRNSNNYDENQLCSSDPIIYFLSSCIIIYFKSNEKRYK